MKAFGMDLRRDYTSPTEMYANSSENCGSLVSLIRFGNLWQCRADIVGCVLGVGQGNTPDKAIAACEAAARRNHAALAELLERMK